MLMDAHVVEGGVKNGRKYAHVIYGRPHFQKLKDNIHLSISFPDLIFHKFPANFNVCDGSKACIAILFWPLKRKKKHLEFSIYIR